MKLGDGQGPRVTPKAKTPKAISRAITRAAALPRIKWSGPVEALSQRAPGAPAADDARNWDSKAEARYEVLSTRWAWSSESPGMEWRLTRDINEPDTAEARWHPTSFTQDLRESDTHLEHIMTA